MHSNYFVQFISTASSIPATSFYNQTRANLNASEAKSSASPSKKLIQTPKKEQQQQPVTKNEVAEDRDVFINNEINATASLNSKSTNNSIETLNKNGSKANKSAWFWVGKETLRYYSNLVLRKYEASLPFTKFNETQVEDLVTASDMQETACASDAQEIPAPAAVVNQSTSVGNIVASNDTNSTTTLNYFNEDLICEHGNLSPTPNKRLICAELWEKIFVSYFQDDEFESRVIVFMSENTECKVCLVSEFDDLLSI